MKVKVKSLSHVRLFVTPWAVAYQAPLSMGFSRQEYWSGLPFPSPGDLPNPGIEPGFPTLEADALTSEPPGNQNKWLFFIRSIGTQTISLSSQEAIWKGKIQKSSQTWPYHHCFWLAQPKRWPNKQIIMAITYNIWRVLSTSHLERHSFQLEYFFFSFLFFKF